VNISSLLSAMKRGHFCRSRIESPKVSTGPDLGVAFGVANDGLYEFSEEGDALPLNYTRVVEAL
jgi:hypothetical protein